MALHVFIVMPFGNKEGIDFDKVYSDYIKPALESEGYEVFRADKELRAGEIRADMFQELLLADLVVADLSIDNPNVWYELGVRHALRARGIILVQSARDHQPFDVYTDRKLRYHVKDGVPDPAFIETDKSALAAMAGETMASWHGKKISPVFYHLPYLREPEWKDLKVGGAQEFWGKQMDWERRVKVAGNKNRAGDILVLAEEAPVQALRLEALKTAGKSLHKLRHVEFALEQFEKALQIDPDDLESRQQKGVLLGRKHAYGEKIVWLEGLHNEDPDDPETLALLGRVRKEAWIENWRKEGASTEQMQSDAAYWAELLREAISPYEDGFLKDPRHYYSGINALTLGHILHHLTGSGDMKKLRDMEGAVRWAVRSAMGKETAECKDYWARVTTGEIEILTSGPEAVEQAYKKAIIAAGNNWFALDSSGQQLRILHDLRFRPAQVAAAVKVLTNALEKLKPPYVPRKVFLFSGHMIDAPGRPGPRFPPEKEQVAALAVSSKLKELGACNEDLGLCGGACGGDLLFAEACINLGLRVEIRIPFDEPAFLGKSVAFAGDKWRERYYIVKKNPNTSLLIMPDELGPLPFKSNPYERNNLWQLYSALSWGAEKVNFVCLWDRKGGDGPGGTKHMHDEVKKRAGQVHVLDTNELFKEDKS